MYVLQSQQKRKEGSMKNKSFVLGMLVITLAFGLILGSCATGSSIGGTSDPHGLVSEANVVTESAEEIATYSVILGIVDSGYVAYASAVKDAEAAGKKITTVTKWFFVLTKTTAYAR
jgi:cytochrome bd-type quinol oxidase subunit 2